MGGPSPADEGRHEPSGDRLWEEAWHLDFATADGAFGGHVRLGVLPAQGVSWVWAAVVGEGRRLVTVVEHEAPVPRAGALDLRCEGLWADLVCEEPLEHWSVGLEAFGVALDEPLDALRGLRGDRIGVGLDLGWESVLPPVARAGGGGYDVACEVSGEVLLGDEVVTFDGWGSRHHTWGVHDRWARRWATGAGRLTDGTRWWAHEAAGAPAEGHVAPPGGGAQPAGAARVVDDPPSDADGLPDGAEVRLDGRTMRAASLRLSPVPVRSPDGRSATVVHGLCRTTGTPGGEGAAWLTWNRPGA